MFVTASRAIQTTAEFKAVLSGAATGLGVPASALSITVNAGSEPLPLRRPPPPPPRRSLTEAGELEIGWHAAADADTVADTDVDIAVSSSDERMHVGGSRAVLQAVVALTVSMINLTGARTPAAEENGGAVPSSDPELRGPNWLSC